MEYVKPLNETDPNAPYINGDASQDIEGSEVPAAAIEQPMREIVNAITFFLGTVETPAPASGEDLQQLRKAIEKAVSTAPYDIAFAAGRGSGGAGEDVAVQTYASAQLGHDVDLYGAVGKSGVVPTGADMEFDVEVNGVSIYETKPKILAGASVLTDGVLTSDPSPYGANEGDVVNFRVLAVGSIIAGQLVTFTLKGRGR